LWSFAIGAPARVAGDGTSCHHRVVTGTLFLVGTPIGNLGDLAPRAVETLAAVDLIAAEDTRRTGRLLAHLQLIDRPLISFFEGNERERTEEVLRRLRDGATVALVTDGGMPTVSDPGFRLVRACAAEGIDVRVVPGPSAAIAALAISGLPTDRFVFEGFLPRKAGERRARLDALSTDPRTIVVFESPKRVQAMVVEALDALGDRPAAVARELTKLHEEVIRGQLSELPAMLDVATLKGEVVVVIGGAQPSTSAEPGELVAEARALVAEGARARDAARAVAKRHGTSANELYAKLLEPSD
jgi:16S rRNA (cytidine1402-2'-O)-methyltransferase